MHASGLVAAARFEPFHSKTPLGQICRQRPQATHADWSTETAATPVLLPLEPELLPLDALPDPLLWVDGPFDELCEVVPG